MMKVYDVVKVVKTGSQLDGVFGRIIGKAAKDIGVNMWIVYLDKEFIDEHGTPHKGVVFPEVCLESA